MCVSVLAMWLIASNGGLNYVLPPVDQVCVQWGHPLLPLLTIQTALYVTIAKITVRFVSLGLAQHTHSVWMYLILVLIAALSTSTTGPARGGFVPHSLLVHHVGRYNFFVWTGVADQSLVRRNWRNWEVLEFQR